jgi:hypothetical protein
VTAPARELHFALLWSAGLPCDARLLGPVPNSPHDKTVGLRHAGPEAPRGRCASRRHLRESKSKAKHRVSSERRENECPSHAVVLLFAFDLGAPAMPPSNAGEAGGVRSRMSEPRGLLRGEFGTGPLCRVAQETPKGRHRGCAFFAQAKKVGRPPQGGETPNYKVAPPKVQRRIRRVASASPEHMR